MWSNVISIDKGLDRETEYLIDGVSKIKELSFAVEESRDRVWLYLASVCEAADVVERKIEILIENVFLAYLKLRFFLDKLPSMELNHSNCALVCALVHFDRGYESNLIRKAISDTSDYNIDGIYNFRIGAVLNNWEELASLADRLLSGVDGSGDVFDIAAFITSTEGAKCRLALCGKRLVNLTDRRVVEIPTLFESEEYNFLSAIIAERPCEIIVEDAEFSAQMQNTLKHIAKVISK